MIHHLKWLGMLLLLGIVSTSPASAGLSTLNDADTYVPGEILVQLKPGIAPGEETRVLSNLGSSRTLYGRRDLFQVKMNQRFTVEAAVEKVRKDPAVQWAQPNYRYHALAPCAAPTSLSDPYFIGGALVQSCGSAATLVNTNWPFTQINAPLGWDQLPLSCPPSGTVTVAVLDTG